MYVVQVRPLSELKTKTRLIRMGYPSLVPMEERLERRAGKWVSRMRTLFSSYVFLDIDQLSANDYHRIMSNENVLRFLGEVGKPTRLSESEEELIRFLDTIKNGIWQEPMIQGEQFTVAGNKLEVEKVHRRQKRATFKVSFAGEEHRVTLSCECRKKADETNSGLIRP